MDSASYLRGEIAKRRVLCYRVAARARINSCRLSQLINNRAPLTDELCRRIMHAINEEAREQGAPSFDGGGDEA